MKSSWQSLLCTQQAHGSADYIQGLGSCFHCKPAFLAWSLTRILLKRAGVLPLLAVVLDEICGGMALDSGGILMFKMLRSFLRERPASAFKICVLSEVG